LAGKTSTRSPREGLRRAVLLNCAAPGSPEGEDAAGVAVIAMDGSTVFTDEVAASWIDELGGNGSVPPVVTAVATQARTLMAGPAHDGRIARARTRRVGALAGRARLGARRQARRTGRRDDRAGAPA
jgi:hypothetical protein